LASQSAVAEPQRKITRLTRNSKLLKVIIKSIQDKKGEHIISLDLRKISESVSDFFVVCEAPSTVQVRAIADWIEVMVKQECGEIAYKREGSGVAQWVLVDYVNVVVHIFLAETRKFYRLEEMWSDGIAQEEIDEEKPKAAPKKASAGKSPSKEKKAVKKL
jgi:ribosome-associated protein